MSSPGFYPDGQKCHSLSSTVLLQIYSKYFFLPFPLKHSGTKPLIRRLKKGSVPHRFPWIQPESESARRRRERGVKRRREEEERTEAVHHVGAYEALSCEGE